MEEAARAIAGARRVLALTGAGVSVESGIPDFRSATGLWQRYPPEEFATIEAFVRDPDKVWRMWRDLGSQLLDVEPNPGHRALARLEQMGHLEAIVTQNIDNLHQAAGSARVVEYHGNARRVRCLGCGATQPLDLRNLSATAPRCECGGVMKPDVVLFGEVIPEQAMLEAEALARSCDVALVVGTSAQVYPAAALPALAREHGATVIECNVETTGLTGGTSQIYLGGPAGLVLPALAEAVARAAGL